MIEDLHYMKQNRKKRASTRIFQVRSKLDGDQVREHIFSFLEKYILCEIAAKELYVGYMDEIGQAVEYKDVKMDLRKLKPAFNHYRLGLTENTIQRLFLGKTAKNVPSSAKMLRDSLVHGMTKKSIAEVDNRFEQLNSDMDSFLNAMTN